MRNTRRKAKSIRGLVVSISLIALASVNASLERLSAQDPNPSSAELASKRMADGKEWMTRNLDVRSAPSYCYEDADANCRKYGRLYSWDVARQVCQSLGNAWRLPTDDEWRRLARIYGGVSEDSEDKGKAAYAALLVGGGSGFDALVGGGRSPDGEYGALEGHGFYWTASEIDGAIGWCYNFGDGGRALHRQSGMEKEWALSVRCVRD